MTAVDLILAALASANLLGVGGLYYRVGVAITANEDTGKRLDRLHSDVVSLAQRVTELERHQLVPLKEN